MAKKYTDEELLDIIRKFYRQHGRPPKRREIAQSSTIMKRFGSWNNALEKAGLYAHKKRWSKEEILKSIDDMIIKYGQPLSAMEVEQCPYLFSLSMFYKLFGKTYNEYIRNDLGFDVGLRICDKKYLKMSDEELLSELKKELDRIGTNQYRIFNRYRKNGFPSEYYFRKRFNLTWSKILEKIDVEPNVVRMSKEEFANWFLGVVKEKGYVPSKSELDNQYSFFNGNLKKHFGNYAKMCKELNIDQPHPTPTTVTETDEELIEMYKKFSEKLGHPATIKDLDTSDEIYNSDVFVTRFGSINELRKICGFTPGKSRKKYTKEEIKNKLIQVYKENGGRISQKQLSKIIPQSTVLRYFKTTRLSDVWDEIEKELEMK